MNNQLDGDRGEFETITLVELAHELDPMETKCVQKALHHVHHHQNTESGADEDEKSDKHKHHVIRLESGDQGAIVEDLGKLRVSKGQGPETKVRRRV